jgi:hypothetical protein
MSLHQWVASYLGTQLERIIQFENGYRVPFLGINLPNLFPAGLLTAQELIDAESAVEKFIEISQLTEEQILSGNMVRCKAELGCNQSGEVSIVEKYFAVLFEVVPKFKDCSQTFFLAEKGNERDQESGFEIVTLTKQSCQNDLIAFLIKQYFIAFVEKINLEQRALAHSRKGMSSACFASENAALVVLQEWLYAKVVLLKGDALSVQTMSSLLGDLLSSLDSVAKPEILVLIASIKAELILKKAGYPKEEIKVQKEKESLNASGTLAAAIMAASTKGSVLNVSPDADADADADANADANADAKANASTPGVNSNPSSNLHPKVPIVAEAASSNSSFSCDNAPSLYATPAQSILQTSEANTPPVPPVVVVPPLLAPPPVPSVLSTSVLQTLQAIPPIPPPDPVVPLGNLLFSANAANLRTSHTSVNSACFSMAASLASLEAAPSSSGRPDNGN